LGQQLYQPVGLEFPLIPLAQVGRRQTFHEYAEDQDFGDVAIN
jgi:hypothetical protein